MRTSARIAFLGLLSSLTGCFVSNGLLTSSVDIPVSQAPELARGTLRVGTETRKLGEYWVTPVPQKGRVFLRQPQRRELVVSYAEAIARTAPNDMLERVNRLKGPVTTEIRGEFLVLKSPTGDFIAPQDTIESLRIGSPTRGKTAVFWTLVVAPPAAGLTALTVFLGWQLVQGILQLTDHPDFVLYKPN